MCSYPNHWKDAAWCQWFSGDSFVTMTMQIGQDSRLKKWLLVEIYINFLLILMLGYTFICLCVLFLPQVGTSFKERRMNNILRTNVHTSEKRRQNSPSQDIETITVSLLPLYWP